ncbi:hypothetical protein [Oricola indica]|uniref:hypothetical protein n=1 Tax=Oricola indica TaxID=2872591 RepID=UPI003CCBC213
MLFVAGVSFALWFDLVMQPPTIRFAQLLFRGDHVMHAATFMALTSFGAWLWARVLLLAGIMIAAGGLLEIAQGPVGRDMELNDWLASSASVAICYTGNDYKCQGNELMKFIGTGVRYVGLVSSAYFALLGVCCAFQRSPHQSEVDPEWGLSPCPWS